MKNQILIITALKSELNSAALPPGVQVVYSGVGKVNAVIATIKAINQFQPTLLINFGTAGKTNPDVHGLISISTVIQRDMMAEPLSPRGRTPFCDRPFAYESASGQYTCASGDSFVTSHDPWLADQNVDVVDMELFAIAAAAHEYKLPWLSFKYITDEANESSAADWKEKVNQGEILFVGELARII